MPSPSTRSNRFSAAATGTDVAASPFGSVAVCVDDVGALIERYVEPGPM